MTAALAFTVDHQGRTTEETLTVRNLVIAGWTGRDKAALEKHIKELEELGVPRPASTPIYYRASAARLTTAGAIECTGPESSGEVEFVLLRSGGKTYVGVGSDHTDRKVETYNITVSKQMCDKPVAPQLWLLDDVLPHWDRLLSRSWAVIGGQKVLYQEGLLTSMLPPLDLVAGYGRGDMLEEGTAMFCGTHAAKGGIRPADRFEFELEDPYLDRKITHGYDVTVLPVVG